MQAIFIVEPCNVLLLVILGCMVFCCLTNVIQIPVPSVIHPFNVGTLKLKIDFEPSCVDHHFKYQLMTLCCAFKNPFEPWPL